MFTTWWSEPSDGWYLKEIRLNSYLDTAPYLLLLVAAQFAEGTTFLSRMDASAMLTRCIGDNKVVYTVAIC